MMRAPRRSTAGRWLPRAGAAAFLLGLTVRAGDAPGTVAEQRARLPPAAECESEIEGRWRSLHWTPNDNSWYLFTLEIHHVADDDQALTGTIHVDVWNGAPDQAEPPPCGNGRRFRATMTAAGSYAAGNINFHGTSFNLDEVVCGPYYGSYNLDNFSGAIDKDLQEFQSVNNDGGNAVDEATVFRRIECFEEKPKAGVDVKPPAFFPVRHASGCSAAP